MDYAVWLNPQTPASTAASASIRYAAPHNPELHITNRRLRGCAR
jgi:hypothetical protein